MKIPQPKRKPTGPSALTVILRALTAGLSILCLGFTLTGTPEAFVGVFVFGMAFGLLHVRSVF